MKNRILMVDDDPNILSAFNQNLSRMFDLTLAQGAEEGLELLIKEGPFAVVVSDMKMPGMDGIEFLRQVKDKAPDTIRIMLTGYAEIQTAITAVNEGNIFRFLNKPCPLMQLRNTLQDGIKQYELVTAEKVLLQRTLKGTIKMLTDILSIVNPAVFSRSSRIRRYAKHIAEAVGMPDVWQLEIAALLSQIGCITISSDIVDRILAGRPVSEEEQSLFDRHPILANKLLQDIPRLETVARIIERQNTAVGRLEPHPGMTGEDRITLGAQIIRTAAEFDRLRTREQSINGALKRLHEEMEQREREAEWNPLLVKALDSLAEENAEETTATLTVAKLNTGMVADEDIKAKNGTLLIRKGQEVTQAVLDMLNSFVEGVGVQEPFRMLVVH